MCGICGKIDKKFLCRKCESTLNKYKICNIDNYDKDNTKYFNNHMYIFKYEGLIRNKILSYKFNEKSYLYKTFTNFLLKDQKVFDFLERYDIIIPVPISKQRYKKRGYNQSLLIAKQISKKTKIELNKKVLNKKKNTVAQSTLNKKERIENAKDVYNINRKYIKEIKNKKILIIDDIFTTGSTVNECAKQLRTVGIRNIGILTIAKD